MPFGAIYGTLFFTVVGFWLSVTALGPGAGPFGAARFSLALISLAVALALLLRRSWARWLGVLIAVVLVGFHLWAAPLGDGVAAHLVLFGSLAALILLVIPATGDPRLAPANGKLPAPRFARALGVLAALGLAGFAAGLWLGTQRPSTAGTASADGAQPAATVAGLAGRIGWTTFGKGVDRAQAEEKPVLVNFVASWCGYCRKMDRTTWKAPAVVDRATEIVSVRVDGEDGRERDGFTGRDLAGRFQVYGFPTLVVLDSAGREIARTSGYQSPDQLISWLDQSLDRIGEP